MFFRRGHFIRMFLLLFLALMLVGAVVSVAGRGSYGEGWTDGFAAAQAAAGDDGGTAAPAPAPQATPYRGWGFGPIGWFFGGVFKFFLFFLLFGFGLKLLGGLFGWGHWRRHRHKGGHYRPWHGPGDRDEPYEKSPEDVEPDVRSF